jgi:uncharacterized RmlC-like cupin family protein
MTQQATIAASTPALPQLPAVAADAVTVIAPSERATLPGPPGAGFVREACVDTGHVWTGFASTEPGTESPWHHHGEYTTYVLPLQGEGVIEFGPDGQSVPMRADGTVYVIPAGLVHREINTGSTRNQAFIVRVGRGPAVVPADPPAKSVD